MRKIIILVCLCLSSSLSSYGQAAETQQLILNWEKLNQLRQILDNMYWGYKILDRGYNTISRVASGELQATSTVF